MVKRLVGHPADLGDCKLDSIRVRLGFQEPLFGCIFCKIAAEQAAVNAECLIPTGAVNGDENLRGNAKPARHISPDGGGIVTFRGLLDLRKDPLVIEALE